MSLAFVSMSMAVVGIALSVAGCIDDAIIYYWENNRYVSEFISSCDSNRSQSFADRWAFGHEWCSGLSVHIWVSFDHLVSGHLWSVVWWHWRLLLRLWLLWSPVLWWCRHEGEKSSNSWEFHVSDYFVIGAVCSQCYAAATISCSYSCRSCSSNRNRSCSCSPAYPRS